MNRDFKGIWIPKEVWLNKELSFLEKGLLAEIDSLFDKEQGGCYASNEYLAEFLGTKEDTVSKALTTLKRLGYILQVSFDGRKRVLKSILPGVGEKSYPDQEKNPTPIYEEKKEYKERVTPKKQNYSDAFETIRSVFPHARTGNKKEAYEEFRCRRTEEKLILQIKILKRQIKIDPFVWKSLSAMQRRLKNLPLPTPENIYEKIEQIGFVVLEKRHDSDDITEGKAFIEDFGEELGQKISKKWYSIRSKNILQSFK